MMAGLNFERIDFSAGMLDPMRELVRQVVAHAKDCAKQGPCNNTSGAQTGQAKNRSSNRQAQLGTWRLVADDPLR
jgi:hypothetical protein